MKTTEIGSTRLAALRQDAAARLRPLCADWPEERFAELVEHVATTTLKYESRDGTTLRDVHSTDARLRRFEDGVQRKQEIRPPTTGLARGLGAIPHVSNRGRGLPPTRTS